MKDVLCCHDSLSPGMRGRLFCEMISTSLGPHEREYMYYLSTFTAYRYEGDLAERLWRYVPPDSSLTSNLISMAAVFRFIQPECLAVGKPAWVRIPRSSASSFAVS
jgi:hypothetical protein